MADVWFRKVGFSRNPFNIKPAAFSYELFGISLDGVLSGIEEGKVLFVEAPLGYGKTTMLKGIIHRFGGRKKVIYANVLPYEKVDVKSLLKRSSIANYVTGNLPMGMILVVDEAQNMMPGNSAEVFEFYRSGNVRAVVFFGTRYNQDGFTDEIRAMMNGNVVRLSRPTPEQAISIVRSRIGNLPILSNEIILSAYQRANGSPRRLLQICEDLCRAAVEKGKLSVSEEEVYVSIPEPSQAKKAAKTANAVKAKTVNAVKVRAVKVKARAGKAKANAKVKAAANQTKQKVASAEKVPRPQKKTAPSQKVRRNKLKNKNPASASATYTVSEPAETTGTEGSYWGEYMGMQK